MSRIGKKPIAIPAGVEVKIEGKKVFVKGPRGALDVVMHDFASAEMQDAEGVKSVVVAVKNPDNVKNKAIWGLTARLISNMIKGVNQGFEKRLEINGVGFRAAMQGKDLKLEVGFSHPVVFPMPQGITAAVEKNIITISGIDRQLVGEIAAQIRKIKEPEPYKGKGIKYIDEVIRRKAGKSVKTGGAA
jgi:large subunit ribosomal protein L6